MAQSGDRDALALMSGFEGDFLLSVLNASPDCVKLVEPDGTLSFMTENGMCAMEIDTFDMVAGRQWFDLWPDQMRTTLQDAMTRARNGERVSLEAECPTAKGTLKWWHITVLPISGPDGVVHKLLAASRDITERVLREREQLAYAKALEQELAEKSELLMQRDFLMREIDHRVKNSLSQVASILRLQARRSSDTVRAALDEAARRVASIARVHEQLQSSTDFKSIPAVPLLQRLCDEFTLSYDRQIPFCATTVDDLPMLSERASALCIIVSELVANGVRHGIGLDQVSVHLHQTDTRAEIRVINTASGPLARSDHAGSGLGTLICETYAATLSGSLDWHYDAGKMTTTLDFSPAA
ncbi:MAG: histidine kinase dimerization/phosphoacceptor domain -containing protein [Pseudotabrizicola sp.]|uniref:sensor histidine kinase n=1 Tax=Pseudotabrizicola sp. TaxID=2939647 RepID=UPI0027301A75|nr:histidine kinase dimerization/phosphoacceptor domain -containing protein [Pseudotabrizicola sp.]MDP2080742.1 histidine kinase dimerization/phosphoacceptor domain -containing protein [Pseudotabrizicola sp.]MDZ7574672.1 histidine kinase dimerization/phosphoacceptor domain -containing protein [Pseudotabrizicola sp.]